MHINYHMGHYLCNKKWGLECTTFPEQGSDVSNFVNVIEFSAGGGKSSKENFLENFNPNRDIALDSNRWLAKGLFHDMMDDGIKPFLLSGILNDNVSGYTNAQFYNALTSNVTSLISYKNLLLQQNNNNQQNSVIQLFNEYGY